MGGIARFRTAGAGRYRVSLDERLWVDVIGPVRVEDSVDHGGPPGCRTPAKMVHYDLAADTDYLLQLSGAGAKRVRMTLTLAPPDAPP